MAELYTMAADVVEVRFGGIPFEMDYFCCKFRKADVHPVVGALLKILDLRIGIEMALLLNTNEAQENA